MTPQLYSAALRRYDDTLLTQNLSSEEWQAALAEVHAARAAYAAVPMAVYPLGSFQNHSGRLIAVDAYCSADAAVLVQNAKQGEWHAYVAVESGVHVALFAYHATALPHELTSASQLLTERRWRDVGSVPIDTATCALADATRYQPLVVEQSHHEVAGIRDAFCFSRTGYGDGGYTVFAETQADSVVAIAVQFILSEELVRV